MAKDSTKTEPALLSQDPHAVREPRVNNLEMAIGHEVRAYRKKLGITVTDLASATGVSVGMLSKIENGNISPSLTTLQTLSKALGVPITAFFRGFEEPRSATFVKAGPVHEVIATSSIEEPVYATPAITAGRIYLRGERHLFAIGSK